MKNKEVDRYVNTKLKKYCNCSVFESELDKKQIPPIEFEVLLRLANIFGMSVNELYDVFDQLHTIDPHITFCNTAGEQLFTMKERIDKWQVLNKYYQAT